MHTTPEHSVTDKYLRYKFNIESHFIYRNEEVLKYQILYYLKHTIV